MSTIRTAVVTGGHTFDVIGFHRLWRGLAGLDVYIQHLEDFVAAPEATRDSYDVLVFYTHFQEPLVEGVLVGDRGKAPEVFKHLGATSQGIVLLHHGIVAYKNWDFWDKLTGIKGRDMRAYSHDEQIAVHVADAAHPITAGLEDWTLLDETYDMNDPGADCHPLLTTAHPGSMKTLAWTRQHKQSRVCCIQSGHDAQCWDDASFQRLLLQAIRWCAV